MRAECEDIRELLAELALGIAGGEERARVLDHATGCRDCRRELEQLTTVTDELLLLAPEAEPPRGFEERVLARIAPRPPRRSAFTRRLLRPALAIAAGAAIASAALVAGYSGDHRLANEYRQALAAADGSRFVAMPLRDGAGVKRGSVSLYEGKPSWIVVALSPGGRRPVSAAEVVSRTGRRIALRGFALRGGVWGGPLPIGLGQVASVQLTGPRGSSLLVAYSHAHW
jgi:Putative zinc-finger